MLRGGERHEVWVGRGQLLHAEHNLIVGEIAVAAPTKWRCSGNCRKQQHHHRKQQRTHRKCRKAVPIQICLASKGKNTQVTLVYERLQLQLRPVMELQERTTAVFRSVLLDSRVKRPPQFAALVVGGVVPRQLTKQQRQYWNLPTKGASRPEAAATIQQRLANTELRPGALLVARTPNSEDAQLAENHCEAMLVRRLRNEPATSLRSLSPILLFSYLCPCKHCTSALCEFAVEHPELQLHVAYERTYCPDNLPAHRGPSDQTNIQLLRAARVNITHTEGLESEVPLVAHRELSQVVRVTLVKGRLALFVQKGKPLPLSEGTPLPLSKPQNVRQSRERSCVWALDDFDGEIPSILPDTALASIPEGE